MISWSIFSSFTARPAVAPGDKKLFVKPRHLRHTMHVRAETNLYVPDYFINVVYTVLRTYNNYMIFLIYPLLPSKINGNAPP